MSTEEDELKQLKKWWDENGLTTVGAIVLAVAVALSWQGWQRQQHAKLDASAIAYQEFMLAVENAESNPGDDIKIAQATHLADQLKSEYKDSGFSFFAAFFKAKQAVADEDYALAEQEFQWVLEQEPEAEIASIAKLRLARVYFEQSRYDEALAELPAAEGSSFDVLFEMLRGDIHLQQEQYQAAVDAYNAAQKAAEASATNQPPFLAVKLQYAESYL